MGLAVLRPVPIMQTSPTIPATSAPSTMDREIPLHERRRARMRRIAVGVVLLAAAGLALAALPGWLRPSVSRARVRIARVERGPVEAVLEASGLVVPASERAVSSPIDARIQKVLKRAGDTVKAGDALVELDTSATRLEIERLDERLAQKRNEQEQLRIALGKSLADLGNAIDAERLDLEILTARAERNKRLRSDGLVSEDDVRVAEVEAKKAQLTLDHLQSSAAAERRATDLRLEGTMLDLRILTKERDEARHRLDLATARADEDGVVTWAAPQEGAIASRGELLAKVARLDLFRVEGTIADVHAPEIRVGETARIRIGDDRLDGVVAAVMPSVEAGAVRFLIELAARSDPRLRPNLRVDVYVVIGAKPDVLRIERGPAVNGGSVLPVFVIEEDRAVLREVRFGLTGSDVREVVDGLAEGQEVILSDMRDYQRTASLRVR